MTALDTRLHAFRPDLADAALLGRVTAARFVRGERFQVAAAQSPVRRAPAADAMLLTEALCGEEVTVFETNPHGWAWAQLEADRYVGWMEMAHLGDREPAATHKVTALRTFVFSGPDIRSTPRAGLSLGARVAVVGGAEDRNASYALLAPAGAVVAQHLAPVDHVEQDWVAVAERFVGTPYLWGGKTSLGIDCSGLVQVALQASGIPAPRDSDMQEAGLGKEIQISAELRELRRGNLIFWKGHVGIMLDGEILLHANAHHMAVAVEPLQHALDRLQGVGVELSAVRRVGRD